MFVHHAYDLFAVHEVYDGCAGESNVWVSVCENHKRSLRGKCQATKVPLSNAPFARSYYVSLIPNCRHIASNCACMMCTNTLLTLKSGSNHQITQRRHCQHISTMDDVNEMDFAIYFTPNPRQQQRDDRANQARANLCGRLLCQKPSSAQTRASNPFGWKPNVTQFWCRADVRYPKRTGQVQEEWRSECEHARRKSCI